MLRFVLRNVQAWVRLSLNLEKIGEFVESLEALRSASEDLHVKGGELLEVRDRLASRYCKYGKMACVRCYCLSLTRIFSLFFSSFFFSLFDFFAFSYFSIFSFFSIFLLLHILHQRVPK